MEKAESTDRVVARVLRRGRLSEITEAHGIYVVRCFNRKRNLLVWEDTIKNVVTTQGKNHALNNYLAGIAYTAEFYFGLISSVSYVGPALGDTAAQINGTNQWKEAGPSNAPDYDELTRQVATFGAAASGGAKTVSVAAEFTMSEAGTLKGAFLGTSNVKEGLGGIIYSAGAFDGGDKAVTGGLVVQVSYTAEL